MSGHSKWSNIKHRKSREDERKGKVFTKLIKKITVAAREGGGDPEGNQKLRMLMDKAKVANMPKENIGRAIKKGTGELAGVNYEAIIYEGYGPEGTAVIVEALTDNKKRTVSGVRHVFTKYGGNLEKTGSVAWMFEHKGIIRATGNLSEDEIFEKLMEYEIDDISFNDGVFTIFSSIKEMEFVKQVLLAADMKIESGQIEWVAKNPVSLESQEKEKKVIRFLGALQDLDDIDDVYTNLA